MDKNYHEHCENCFKLNCTTFKACKMIFCKLDCGARFHECKSHEHSLLCVKETVSCSNAVYGCPVKVKRSRLSQHLVVCPASIVFCTMQWNRYPLYSKSRLSWVPFFQPNPVLVKGHLDVELALRDQRVLQEMFKKRLRKGKAKVDILRTNSSTPDGTDGGDVDKNARHVDTRQIDMAVALSALEHKLKPLRFITEAPEENFNALAQSIGMKMKEEDLILKDFETESEMLRPDTPRAAILCENINSNAENASCNKTNTDGDQLREQNSKSDTPNVNEVGEILRQCLETNKGEIKDNTSDNQLIDSTNTITAGYSRGSYCNQPLINEPINTQDQPITTDDEETSDIDLPEPPKFKDIYLKEPLGLNVMLETLPKFQKQAPLYSIPCNQVFRRNEYGDHFKNVHSEIHGGLNGWVEHRCPLAQYGCTYVHHRLLPNNQCGRITFNKELGSFGVKYCAPNIDDDESVNTKCTHHITMETDQDFLSSLPLEILETIASLLDGFSLCQLSCTSKLLRQVCQRVLERNGLVSLEWEKRIYDNGTRSWQVRQKKWFFSAAFSPIKDWVHSSSPGMASHLEKCPYFERYVPNDKFCYQEVDSIVDGYDDMDYNDEPSDKELDIERHWQELREIAGMY